MKALQITSFGIDGLAVNEIEQPQIAENQVLVRVKAATLNYLDLLVVKGVFNDQLPLPHIPLTDVAGEVAEVGSKVTKFKVGDAVIPTFIRRWTKGTPTLDELNYGDRPSLGMQGYMSEFLAVNEEDLVLNNAGLTHGEASTLPIAGLTAWNAIKYMNLQSGQSVLLYGTGGVASFACQFAKAQGVKVYVAGRKDASLEKMKGLGADQVYNVISNETWVEDLMADTGGFGVDGVFESVGGENVNKSLAAVKIMGHIVYIGLIDGFSSNMDITLLTWKQITLKGMEVGSTADFEDMMKSMKQNNIKPPSVRNIP